MSPTTPLPTLDPTLFPGLIQHYPEHRLLYCQPCTAVVFPTALFRHLQRLHQPVPVAQRKLLVQYCHSLDLAAGPKDLQLPPENSPPLLFVPVQKGYSCGQCRFLTCSRSNVRRHLNRAHGLDRQACTDSYRPELVPGFPGPILAHQLLRLPARYSGCSPSAQSRFPSLLVIPDSAIPSVIFVNFRRQCPRRLFRLLRAPNKAFVPPRYIYRAFPCLLGPLALYRIHSGTSASCPTHCSLPPHSKLGGP
jgi:hypothetical protein